MSEAWWFTFGHGHVSPGGVNMMNAVVKIEGNYGEARDKMFELCGEKWAFQYDSPEAAGIGRFYGIYEIGLDDLKAAGYGI